MTIPAGEVGRLPTRYATFTGRVRAAVTDIILISVTLVVTVMLGDAAERVPGSGRVAVAVIFALLFLYEPLFVWRRGATIGHGKNHLIVISERTGRPPGPGRAFVRYLIKVIFGIPSFVTIPLSRRHQAVHDWATRTTVRVAPGAEGLVDGFLIERVDDADVVLPSRSRRMFVALAYLIALFLAYGISLAVVDRRGCIRAQNCSPGTSLLIQVIAVGWFALSILTIAATWRGLLWGARRRSVPRIEVPLA